MRSALIPIVEQAIESDVDSLERFAKNKAVGPARIKPPITSADKIPVPNHHAVPINTGKWAYSKMRQKRFAHSRYRSSNVITYSFLFRQEIRISAQAGRSSAAGSARSHSRTPAEDRTFCPRGQPAKWLVPDTPSEDCAP